MEIAMKYTRIFTAVSIAACLFAAAGPASAADDSLYRDLGGETGIVKIANLTADHFLADPRIKQTFDNTDMARFRKLLAEQFCVLAGGPCQYTGHTMLESHKGLHLTNADFNFVVEDLQMALEEAGVAFRIQNRLLALLAPMQRDIVTR
jgi:hemoglobin